MIAYVVLGEDVSIWSLTAEKSKQHVMRYPEYKKRFGGIPQTLRILFVRYRLSTDRTRHKCPFPAMPHRAQLKTGRVHADKQICRSYLRSGSYHWLHLAPHVGAGDNMTAISISFSARYRPATLYFMTYTSP